MPTGVTGINPLQSFRITILNVGNPISTSMTSSFNLSFTDGSLSTLSILNIAASPVTVMTNTPYTLSQANFQANTTGAGQNASYTITVFP